jgi:pantoate kinase
MVIVAQMPVSIAKAFSPGHLTGFFATDKIVQNVNPIFNGSVGAGFSISQGINTTVKVYNDFSKSYKISVNGMDSFDAKVSKFVVEHYLKMINKQVFISVEHESEIPIGYGLGSSGSAALSLSYALNQALKANLSLIQAAQIAHQADIACKTGLGSVISEFIGGFEIRTSIGGPGIGKILKIPVSSQLYAVIFCIKPINTDHVLEKSFSSCNNYSLKISGKVMIEKLLSDPSIDTFLELSHVFAKEYGLLDGYCKDPILKLKSVGMKCSVALFGHTLFTVVKKGDLDRVVQILKQFEGKLIVCNIDNIGARLVV